MKVIAEIGAPSALDWALDAAEEAARAGAWALKVQLYRKDRLVTRDAAAYSHGLAEAPTQWANLSIGLSEGELGELSEACDAFRLVFFASVWDERSADLADRLRMPWLKIGSGDITYKQLIQYVARKEKPMFLSTGASTPEEIARALEWIDAANPECQVVPMVCTLSYPAHDDDANIARVTALKEVLDTQVGYSNHTRGWFASVAARQAGADYYETHFTISPGAGGDHDFAADLSEFIKCCNDGSSIGSVQIERFMGSPELKVYPAEEKARLGARRSLVAAVDIPRKTYVTPDMFTFLRPGTGIPPYRVDELVGQRAALDIPKGTVVTDNMIGHVIANLTVE